MFAVRSVDRYVCKSIFRHARPSIRWLQPAKESRRRRLTDRRQISLAKRDLEELAY